MSAATLPTLLSPRLLQICAVKGLAVSRSFIVLKALRGSGKCFAAGPERGVVTPPDWWTIDVRRPDAQPVRCCNSPCSREFCNCLACA